MNSTVKRLISVLLTAAMLLGMIPSALAESRSVSVEPGQAENVRLPGSGIALPEDANGTYLAFVSSERVQDTPLSSWTLQERGSYVLTVYRAGDLSGETTVDLRSIDVSATYGEDYVIEDARYETLTVDNEGTLVQRIAEDPEAEAKAQEILDGIAKTAEDASAEASGTEQPAPEAPAAGEAAPIVVEEIEPVAAEEVAPATPTVEAEAPAREKGASPLVFAPSEAPAAEAPAETVDVEVLPASAEAPAAEVPAALEEIASEAPKSELARMKEEQTGLPSRETYDTELLPMDQDLISYLVPDLGSAMEASSSTTLTFAPGETEKTVTFRILEDETAEANEAFSFTLSDVQGGAVFMPSVMNVMILDDEPVEHSAVTFSQANYVADGEKVHVTVRRSGADYSLVTAKVISVDEDSAVEGVNYAKVDCELSFEPYCMEAGFDVTVRGTPGRETAFSLRLYDLKGGVDGENVTAVVTIPAASGTQDGRDATASLLADTQIKIPGFGGENYYLEKANGDTYNIIDRSKKPAQVVGTYILPTDANGWTRNFGDSPSNYDNKWENDHRHLRWYSRLAYDYGGTDYITTLKKTQNYQQLFMDFSTNTKYSSNKHGFWFQILGPSKHELETQSYELGGKNSRDVRGAKSLYTDYTDTGLARHDGKLIAPYWSSNAADNQTTITAYVKRTAFGCIEPEMDLHGFAAMYREYHVSLEQPDAQQYVDVGANGDATVVSRAPARSSLGTGHHLRYPYQQIAVTDTSLNPGDPIGGTLLGYYIKIEGAEGNGVWYPTTGNIIDLNDDLMRRLDEYARDRWNGNESVMKKSGGSYYMSLTVKPVYEKTYLTVKVLPNPDGKFKWSCLDPQNTAAVESLARSLGLIYETTNWSFSFMYGFKKETRKVYKISIDPQNGTISGLFSIGDKLNLDAAPAKEGYEYTSCLYKGFKNPGDTVAEESLILDQHSQVTNWKQKVLRYSRTELKPQFTNNGNCIEIRYENGADQYFYLSQIATAKEKNGAFPDKRVLRIDDSYEKDNVTPVLGHAYTLSAVESNSNDGTVRPVFTLWDGTVVNGWAVDIIAGHRAEENVIKVGWERYDPSKLKTYAVEGVARYESVTVRQSSQGLKNEPAKDVLVTAAGVPIPSYTKTGKLGQALARQSASTDGNGRFVLNGVQAIPGDRISVLLDDNGVVKAEYRFLPRSGVEETRSYQIQQANHSNKTNEVVTLTGKCLVADVSADTTLADAAADAFRMPIITGYVPYVTDVRFRLDEHAADGRNNTVPIYAGDSVTLEADVSIPKLGDEDAPMKALRFVIIDKDGEIKDTYATTRRLSGDGQPMNTWYIDVPYSPPQSWPYQALADGDQVYVQVVGPDRTVTKVITDDAGNTTEEQTQVENPYSLLNTGLSFFTPVEDEVKQSYNMQQKNLGTNDLLGKLSAHAGTNTLIFDTQYADPNNKATSNYTKFYGFSLSGNSAQLTKYNKLKKAMSGDAKAAQQSFDQKWDAISHDATNAQYGQAIANENARINDMVFNNEMSAEDGIKAKEDFAAGKKREYTDGLKKDSLSQVGEGKFAVKASLSVVVAYEWVYDKESNSHVEWGYAWNINVGVNASKTFYTVYVVPFYLNLDGSLSISYEAGGAKPAQRVYAKEFAKKTELREYDSSDYGWFFITLSAKISVGVGLYGILGARGIVKFGFAFAKSTVSGWDPNSGVSFALGGGFAIDLWVTTLGMEWMTDPWVTGYYEKKPVKKVKIDEDGSGTKASLQSEPAGPVTRSEGLKLKPYDLGRETYNAIEEGRADLQSILVPKKEETIIDGAMQYVRPQAVALDSDTFMIFFLENKQDAQDASGTPRSAANAPTLVYAVADVDANNNLIWNAETKTVIVDNDGFADLNFDVLKTDDSVYVAWATSDLNGRDTTTAEGVRDALSASAVKLKRFSVSGSSVTEAGSAVVSADQFQNSSPILIREGENIAVYYFKQDLARVNAVADLVNFTGNYSTWAKRLYSTSLVPQAQTGNASAIAADQEMLIRLPEDKMTGDFTVISYKGPADKEYRLAAYTVDSDGDPQSGDDLQIWLQVQNVTDGRAYHPLKLTQGAVANLQLNDVRIKTRELNYETGVYSDVMQDDVFLTWISDGTCFNTLSMNDLFAGLKAETGAAEALSSLTAAEAASPDWPMTAFGRTGYESREDCPTLYAIAHGESVFNTQDFGDALSTAEDADKNGDSLTKYVFVTGADGNTYLAWARTSTLTGNMGSEVWMCSYYRFNSEVREDYRDLEEQWAQYDSLYAAYREQIEAGSETAVPPEAPHRERPEPTPFEGWSKPVQITDFRMSMTEADRARYDELTAKERSEEENAELAALNKTYSRAIDELAVVVSQDSGALMLANTYSRAADHEIGYREQRHKLTAIRCVPDTSLELANFTASDLNPAPEDYVILSFDIVNTGLLPGTDYRFTVDGSIDGGEKQEVMTWELNEPYFTVYPGGSRNQKMMWQAPAYENSIRLDLTITEKNPVTGGTDYETSNTATLTLSREAELTADQPRSRYAPDFVEDADEIGLASAIMQFSNPAGLGDADAVQYEQDWNALIDYYTEGFYELLQRYGSVDTLLQKIDLLNNMTQLFGGVENLMNACNAIRRLGSDEAAASKLLAAYSASSALEYCGGLNGLLNACGEVSELLSLYGSELDADSDAAHAYFFAFLPVSNTGCKDLTDLHITVRNENGRVLGESTLDSLKPGDGEVNVPTLLAVRETEFGNFGMINTTMTVTDSTGAVLLELPLMCQILDNVDLQIVAPGIQVLQESGLQQLYEADGGTKDDAVWQALESDNVLDHAKRIDLTVGESIRLDTEAFPYNSDKDVIFVNNSYRLNAAEVGVAQIGTDGTVTALTPGVAVIEARDCSSGSGWLTEKAAGLTESYLSSSLEGAPSLASDLVLIYVHEAIEGAGDLNGDGQLNAKDVTYLRRHLAGGYGVTLDDAIADVNKDGYVNAKDVTTLRRYLAGGYGITLG